VALGRICIIGSAFRRIWKNLEMNGDGFMTPSLLTAGMENLSIIVLTLFESVVREGGVLGGASILYEGFWTLWCPQEEHHWWQRVAKRGSWWRQPM